MAAREIVLALRLSEGTTREQFRALKGALIDVRDEITQNNKALRENAKAQRELDTAVKEGAVTAEQAAVRSQALLTSREQLKTASANLASQEASLSAVYREVRNDVGGLTDAGLRFRDKMAEATIEALKQEGVLGKLGARMDFLRREQERLTQEQKDGKITQDQYRISAEKLAQEEKELGVQMSGLNAKVDALTKEFQQGKITQEEFRKGVNAINTSVENVGTAVNKGVQDLKNYALGFVGVVAVAQGAITVLKNIGKTVANFQQANTNLAAILGTTRDKITELTDSAIKIGPAFARAPEEVTQLQTELAKLGFTVPEVLAAQEAIISLANATGEELGKSAEVAAATLNGFNLEATETGRVVDVITEAANRSSLDLEKFSVAMATVAPAANQAGFSIEETTALIGVLSDRGLDASTAGTALRSMFIDLAKTGQTFEQAMAEINASTNKTGTAFKLFGERAAGAAVILAEAGTETKKLTEDLNNAGGSAERVAKEQLDTLSNSVNRLAASWDAFVLSIDQGSGPISQGFRAVIGSATQLLEILAGTNEFNNFKNELEDVTDRARETANDTFLLTRSLRNLANALALKPDGLLEQIGLSTSQATKDVGGLLGEFNKLKEGIALTTDENGKLKELRIAPEDKVLELTEFARKLNFEIAKARAQAISGTLSEEDALKKQQALLILLKEKVTPAIVEANAARVKAAEDGAKASGKDLSAIGEEVVAIGSLKAKREELTKSLEDAKKRRDALAATDTKGIEAANAQIAAIEKQVAALDGKTKKDKAATEAEREKTAVTQELTKAEEARARGLDIAAEAARQREADPNITPAQATEQAGVVVDTKAQIDKAQGDAELLIRIEENKQAQLLAIREKYAKEQTAQEDKVAADLRTRRVALAQNELAALEQRQEQELSQTTAKGDELTALIQRQADERAALKVVIEEGVIEAQLEKFDAEYALAVSNGEDILALTAVQQEELAALRASFGQAELDRQVTQLEAEQSIQDAKIAAVGGFGQALQSLAKEGSAAAKVGLALEKASAIASIIVNTQRANAVIQGFYPLGTPLTPAALAAIAANKIQAATAIATIVATGIAGFAEGGEVNGDIKRSHGKPIRRSNGDNVLITAKAGEKILNEEQQEELERQHGKDVWKRIGLPGAKYAGRTRDSFLEINGYATGGAVTRGTALVNVAAPDLTAIESVAEARSFELSVVADIEEIVGVMDRRMRIIEMARG